MSPEQHQYDSGSIQFLKDLEGVRKRPAMYIGDTDFGGYHHLLWEIVDNSVDEALAGYCSEVHVVINEDGSATVEDDGRGIPVDVHPEEGVPAVELVLTKLHAGGKFDGKAYAVSGGLHGVGISVVNALSERTEVEIFKGGKHHRIVFSRGLKVEDLEVVGKTERQGTRVSFMPDREMFQHHGFDFETVKHRLREMAYLMGSSNLRIVLEEEAGGRKETFHYPEGLVSYIDDLTESKEAITDVVHFLRQVEWEGRSYGVEVALRYTNDWNEGIFSFANNIRTAEGGTHLTGFRAGLTRTLNNALRAMDLLKKGDPPGGDDYRAGLYAVVSVKVPDPQFEGQTKGKLGSREVASIVESVVGGCMGDYLEEHPEATRAILRKALLARDAREAARKQRDLVRRKGALSSGSLPGKLADCQSRDRDQTELYIVEGDSAGGSAKTGRDRRFQAILPLKGKILNVEKNTANRILANQELQTMIQAIGAGIGEEFDPERCRYGKIIIMTDADVDGSHIRTLILTFFFRQMRALIEANRVFIACPPLYRLQRKGAKSFRYIHGEDELNAALMEQALGDARLQLPDGSFLEGEALRQTIDHLQHLRRATRSLVGERRGVDAAEYLMAARAEDGDLPMAVVVELPDTIASAATHGAVGGEAAASKRHFFWSNEELEEFLGAQGDAKVWDGPECEVPREEARFLVFHLVEKVEAQPAVDALREVGLAPVPRAGQEYVLHGGKDARAVEDPMALVSAFRELGMKHIDVQRYKGLGEMNPDQLWESTMDPEKRLLKRIVLEDAFEADRMFSVLMGDDTDPRREYIAEHAHEVENLDI